MINPFLIGDKIYLSPLVKEDVTDTYVEWLNDAYVCEHNSHAVYPNTYDKTMSYVTSISNEIVFAIKLKEKNVHIGNVSIQKINNVNRSAELAIIIGDKKFWGMGIGKETYRLMLFYGFNRLNLNKISSGQTVTNVGMIKVCQANGMKQEGISRQALYKNGKYVDACIYSILAEEYNK